MYFEFGQGLQAGLDCAGEVTPGQGAFFGWVRYPAGAALRIRVEQASGGPVETLLLDLHPRQDIDCPEGMAVAGFSLIHDLPPRGRGRLLVLGAGPAETAREVAIDLLAYDLPSDVRAATHNREWGANFNLLHASALAPQRLRTLAAEEGSLGIFGGWLDRLPRLAGGAEWFLDFQRVSAVLLPTGELAVSGRLSQPEAGERVQTAACLLVRWPGREEMRPLPEERHAPLSGGFALSGRAEVPPDASVELVVQVRRGGQGWWFRAEPAMAALPDFLDALSLAGGGAAGPDAAALQGWMRGVLAERSEALRGRLSALSLAGVPSQPGGTALFFDLDDDFAGRVLTLLAPVIEARFGRVVLSGAAAGKAGAALMRRGRVEVSVEADAEEALASAARGPGPVAAIDTAALIDAAIEGDAGRLAARALPADRLAELDALHGMAGTGGMESTLRRVVALMAGAEAGALTVPAGRSDALGEVAAEHLRELWEMVPVRGVAR
ncbi:hypothetical protein [Muricoccus pecuniae]|uniref:Uncharacterized protein n=1 Tax=Muricoccus pecuniae TaxID=693023 RepID=A0A840YJ58_9PROT|nr:hypothetical protein [Roseomonas pecuniae]MBB5694014.1 hypothetical protein [Roseomonas pecuniae]